MTTVASTETTMTGEEGGTVIATIGDGEVGVGAEVGAPRREGIEMIGIETISGRGGTIDAQ